ncbi:Morn repeat protein [Pandoravirus inopinatum]|uniref:Morn repeat protein n=1 Tax=Pandoravirus inopinatum TaxID=1605721 RepID=A0A0B5J0G6_9VIRU|nr:Morn repeat protein [Pandoravirus inopinatum]AJF96964.1 Morn repeat protein [Pandoravirus inopinatum]
MDALPCEIMLAILEWLERPSDLAAIGMTSRQWHEVASDDRLWRALLRRRFPKWADDVERFARIDPGLRPDTAKDTLRMLVTCAACGRVPPMVACGRRGKGTRPNETLFAFNADGASKKVAHARLCGPCMDPRVGGAATKTDLKKRFMLNNDDLDALPYVERCNPYYRGAGPCASTLWPWPSKWPWASLGRKKSLTLHGKSARPPPQSVARPLCAAGANGRPSKPPCLPTLPLEKRQSRAMSASAVASASVPIVGINQTTRSGASEMDLTASVLIWDTKQTTKYVSP